MGPSSLQSVTDAHKIQDSKDSPTRLKGFSHKTQRILPQDSKLIYNSKSNLHEMQKNPDKNFVTVEVDPATDEYYVTIPEWIINDLGWYEGTDVEWSIEGGELVLREIQNE